MDLKPIETEYKGCRFRSRLEARWAVFFDYLGTKWEYEPEGFQTSAGPYLPDFRVEYPRGEVYWVEIKPSADKIEEQDWRRWQAFDPNLLVLVGVPELRYYYTSSAYPDLSKELPFWLWSSKDRVWWDTDFFLGGSDADWAILAGAVRTAKGARFEHGESGAKRFSR